MTQSKKQTNSETFAFQAEVAKVLDIVVNALYSHKEIFLRELISNASDACDKRRYAGLTQPELIKDAGTLQIELIPNKEKNTLAITDNGIGMSRQDLIDNLGTIARSGSAEFAAHLTGDKKKDLGLIGQFGVGFYAAFMVADKVEVLTRKAGQTDGYLWTSSGNGFTIDKADDIPVGTRVTLFLKKDADEFTDPLRLRFLVHQYSEYIDFPIILESNGNKETLNAASALWTRNKADITEEQYRDFYRNLTHAFDEPYMTLHYTAEGVIEYKALLFIPQKAPFDLFQPDKKFGLNLYVNKVFISDEVEELLPHYLRFVRGLIDTSELPLNVSREMLQHTPVLAKIKKGIMHRILDALLKKAEDKESYEKYWHDFGIVFKEGLYEDRDNETKIADLCRFYSSTQEGFTTLKDYVTRMKPEQKNIYYLTGDDIAILRNNPQLEGFTARGVEVLLLTDPIDEFWPQVFTAYDGKKILSVTHPDADINALKFEEQTGESMEEGLQKILIERFKSTLQDEVKDVVSTTRLNKSPVALVAGKDQMSIHLERLMRQHGQAQAYASDRTLEINPRHPVLKKLAAALFEKKEDKRIDDAIWILYDQARAIEGEPLRNPSGFMEKVNAFLEVGL